MTMPLPSAEGCPSPSFLEYYPEPGGDPERVPIAPLPFRVGRNPSAHLILRSPQVSKEHAEVYRFGEQYCIRDLNSTNGTYVNGQNVREAFLVNGDIVHVGHQEFRFVQTSGTAVPEEELAEALTEVTRSGLPPSFIRGGEQLRDLLRQHCVRISFQPIIELATSHTRGFEALGRGTHSDLSIHPSHLFQLAERCSLEQELSRLFRAAAVREAASLPDETLLFLNLHPKELDVGSLMQSLDEIRTELPGKRQIVLEVHEDAEVPLTTLLRLRDELQQRGLLLAYDDFGAGQARLTELVTAPPDFIKLDMRLIRGIDRDGARQTLVQALSRLINEFGIQVIAEGIETPEEAAVCLRLGCHYGQGFLFGMPQDAETFAQKPAPDTHLFNLSELRQRMSFQKA